MRPPDRYARLGFHSAATTLYPPYTRHEPGNQVMARYMTIMGVPQPAIDLQPKADPCCFNYVDYAQAKTWGMFDPPAGGALVRRSAGRGARAIYLEALPLFTRGAISIPDHAPLLRELRLLERATHRGGRDSVDHPRAGSDDYANAVCGCAVSARKPSYDIDAVNDALDRVYGRLTTTSLWGMPMATR